MMHKGLSRFTVLPIEEKYTDKPLILSFPKCLIGNLRAAMPRINEATGKDFKFIGCVGRTLQDFIPLGENEYYFSGNKRS